MDPGNTVVLGVDPAKNSGWGIVLGRRLIAWGLVSPSEGFQIESVLSTCEAAKAREGASSALLAIEDQWVPDLRGGDLRTMRGKMISALKVAHVRGRWEGLAQSRGMSVEFVHPSTWRSAELGTHRLTSDQAKKKAKTVVQSFYPQLRGRKIAHDTAEAILIALYAAQRRR